ncbi:hypothetical protein RU99_GL001648 [Enterococcus casseliflavus]|nr:hypothetical protein RU99_GL001648 [Enterococcus casseliflavus]
MILLCGFVCKKQTVVRIKDLQATFSVSGEVLHRPTSL